jgi:hypothetical protein
MIKPYRIPRFFRRATKNPRGLGIVAETQLALIDQLGADGNEN